MRQYIETAVTADVDQVFDTLAHERRRHVLSCLDELEHPISRSDLADEVATLENGGDTRPSLAEVAAVNRSLHHVHIPKLAAVGFVEYDEDAKLVELVV